MATNQTIDFKDPLWIMTWLDTALKKEKEKYQKVPVRPDLVPGYEAAQAWAYVVSGYFLVEESFKALLYLREKSVPTKHSLTILFNLFEPDDKEMLREYYSDYRGTMGSAGGHFPFETLDDFLTNLDGDPNARGTDYIGSFDWRYFLIEEQQSENMPVVSVEFLHEIVYGCIRMVEYARSGNHDPSRHTRSWRLRRKRERKYSDWFTVRMNSDGWKDLGDRLEILWGPDYRGRYDWLLFEGGRTPAYFSELPKECSLPIVDKRKEIEEFDIEEGFRSIGLTRVSRPADDD